MKTRLEIIEILHRYKGQYAEKYGIRQLGIFGSIARGEQKADSDLDVFVDIRTPDPYILSDIHDELESLTGYRIDLLRLRNSLNSLLKTHIERDGILV